MHAIARPLSAAFGTILATASLAAGKPAAAPSGKTVVLRSTNAHRVLGPCTIQATGSIRVPDTLNAKYKTSIKWNDATHYAMTLNMDGGVVALYVNGADRILVDAEKRQWTRLDSNDPEHLRKFQVMQVYVPHSVLDRLYILLQQDAAAEYLSRTPVTETSVAGTPAYRVYVPGRMTTSGSTSYLAVAIGIRDGLIYKVATRREDDGDSTMTVRYTRQRTPFPMSTFAFKPPTGYTETDFLNKDR